MNACNATLTTATVSPCPNNSLDCGSMDTISNCYVDGEPTVHVELHTLTCIRYIGHGVDHFDADGACWCDDTHGAKPHTPTSTVTDAEVQAAVDAMLPPGESWTVQGREDAVVMARGYLEAAARVRAAQEDIDPPCCCDDMTGDGNCMYCRAAQEDDR